MSLFIDDGVADRGHRSTIMNDDFGVVGNFSGPHKVYGIMTTQDFAGSYINKGEKVALKTAKRVNPAESAELKMNTFMEAFMDEKVHFDMPEKWLSWSQSTSTNIDGNVCTKTVIRTVKFAGGATKDLTVTQTKIFS